MVDFVTKLSNESWEAVFDSSDINYKFNCSLNTYLGIFYSKKGLTMKLNAKHG
jgi:hypothetical protein